MPKITTNIDLYDIEVELDVSVNMFSSLEIWDEMMKRAQKEPEMMERMVQFINDSNQYKIVKIDTLGDLYRFENLMNAAI